MGAETRLGGGHGPTPAEAGLRPGAPGFAGHALSCRPELPRLSSLVLCKSGGSPWPALLTFPEKPEIMGYFLGRWVEPRGSLVCNTGFRVCSCLVQVWTTSISGGRGHVCVGRASAATWVHHGYRVETGRSQEALCPDTYTFPSRTPGPQWEERSRAVRWGRSVREPRAQRGAWLATPAPETFVEPGMRGRGGGALGTRTRVRSRGRAGAGVGAESDLLVELLYLLALVPSENTQQPFLGWRREWPRVPVGWRCSAPAPNPGLPRVAPPPPPRGQRTQPARGAPGRGVRGGREADELTSETTDGHCARLVVRVHSLKLREGHGVSAAARPGPARSFPPRCAHLQASRHTAWQPRRSWTKAWCSS